MAIVHPSIRPDLESRVTAYRLDIMFPPIGEEPENIEIPACPHCGCRGFHRHQRTPKRVKDQRRQTVSSRRYLCKGCRRSIRLYPAGVSARRQSEAIRALSVVLYRLGLSYRNVQQVLGEWACPLGAATIWQNVQGLDAAVRGQARRGRVTAEVESAPGQISFPADGPSTFLRLVTDPQGTMRLEIRTRDDWRSVWRRINLPSLSDLGVRLIGVKPLFARLR